MFKIPSTVEKGVMFLKMIAVNEKKVFMNTCGIVYCRIVLFEYVLKKQTNTHCLHYILLAVEIQHLNLYLVPPTPRLYSAMTKKSDTGWCKPHINSN